MRSTSRLVRREPAPKVEPCEWCGSKKKCLHRLVPAYQHGSPDLFGRVNR